MYSVAHPNLLRVNDEYFVFACLQLATLYELVRFFQIEIETEFD